MHYTPYAIHSILNGSFPEFVKKDGCLIMNEPVSFDIEVTSMRTIQDEKVAFMYVWMLDIFDKTIIGRTWTEFLETLSAITNYFQLIGLKKRIVIYVHNLAYEFQFIRKWFNWVKVFSLARRKPLYAITSTGVEFRCSYRLTGYKLEKVGEQMGIEKLGDFDYHLIRTYMTKLTPREYEYCIHDVKIVSECIRRKIAEEGSIAEIPLTKTGYVRRHVRNETLKGANRCFYKAAIKALTLEAEEYMEAKRAFAGGFTHAALLHSGKEYKNVTSYDFSSSYPAVLVAEKYPMTKGIHLKPSRKQFNELMEREECCIFTIEIEDVQQIFPCESYISESRCSELEGWDYIDDDGQPKHRNPVVNNGRVWSAKRLVTDITSIDYNIMKKVYTFKVKRVAHFYYYEKYYLPTTFVKCILEFYSKKTELKDVVGKEVEYMFNKENVNALFGMCCTDIVRELVEYNNDWEPPKKMKTEEEKQAYRDWVAQQVEKENEKRGRFLFYLWGVFCTAYARKNLWTGIFECKYDYLYSDTDSVKITNAENHAEYFDRYNEEITAKLEHAMDYHKLPYSYLRPKTIKGDEKPLGVWDFDGFYLRFKAVRAKAYMTYGYDKKKKCNAFKMTVAGLSKEDAMHYLETKGDPIKQFQHEMYIPPTFIEDGEVKSATGKLTHTYIDEPFSCEVTDYQNHTCVVMERSCVHLEPADYHLSLTRAYQDFLTERQSNQYV